MAVPAQMLKPVFLKNSEIQNDRNNKISDFEIVLELSKKIDDVKCVQLDRDLWRIYVGSVSSKTKLVTEGFDLRSRNVQVYTHNPFSTGTDNPDEEVLKVTIKGVPLSVEDSAVKKMLEQFKVSFCSDIKYEKITNPSTLRMTEVLNGNRFVYVKPLKTGEFIPRSCVCAGIKCLIYHKGQPSFKRSPKCTKCWSNEHFTYQCDSEQCCKACKTPGHTPGDEACDVYTEADPNIIAFSGQDNILSNFHLNEITVFGVEHKSSEHAYQYVKAMRSGDLPRATAIQAAPTALDAKQIGKNVLASQQFIDSQYNVMKEIVEAKLEQVQEFHDALKNAPQKALFVESTYDDFWGSGLNKLGTIHTDKSEWPGKNNRKVKKAKNTSDVKLRKSYRNKSQQENVNSSESEC